MFPNIFNNRTAHRAMRGITSADASDTVAATIDYSPLVDCTELFLNGADVAGWRLPPNLAALHCSAWTGSTIPPLPSSVTYLYCDGGHLDNLPALPPVLFLLDCSNDGLTSLPALPNTLHSLYCGNNALSGIPNIPASLGNLYCNDCGWTSPQVNTLMAQLVASGIHDGVMDCSGSNAAPTGQGVTDAATLVGRGWTVTTS